MLDPIIVSSSLHERRPPVDPVLMVQVGSEVDQQASDRQVATYEHLHTVLDKENLPLLVHAGPQVARRWVIFR